MTQLTTPIGSANTGRGRLFFATSLSRPSVPGRSLQALVLFLPLLVLAAPAIQAAEGTRDSEARARELHGLYLRVKDQRDTLMKNKRTKLVDQTAAREANRAIDLYNSQWQAFYIEALLDELAAEMLGIQYNNVLKKYDFGVGPLARISNDGTTLGEETSNQPPSPAPEPSAVDPRGINLAGSWRTLRVAEDGTRYEGTLELTKAGNEYVGRWVQNFQDQFSTTKQVVQDVKVTVSPSGVTITAIKQNLPKSEYDLDREYLTAQSADLLVGSGVDIASKKASCRISRITGQTDTARTAKTFKLYTWANSSGTKLRAVFDSLPAAQKAADTYMRERGQRGYTITDGRDPTTVLGSPLTHEIEQQARVKHQDRF